MAKQRAMDERTRRSLIEGGVMTSRGLTMNAKPRACFRCGADCIAGLGYIGPAAGVWLDEEAITPLGEFLATVYSIPTWWIQDGVIEPRVASTIAEYGAGEFDVYVTHICRGPLFPRRESKKKLVSSFPELPPF